MKLTAERHSVRDAPRAHRVVDKYNAKVFRVRFEKQEDVVRLQESRRIGEFGFGKDGMTDCLKTGNALVGI